MGQTRPPLIHFGHFHITMTNIVQKMKIIIHDVLKRSEPGTKWWQAQTNPLSYGGRPKSPIILWIDETER